MSMAKGKKFEELLMATLQELKQDVKDIRQTDIPNIKTDIAVVKSESKTSARIISGVGGLIAIATSVAIAWFK